MKKKIILIVELLLLLAILPCRAQDTIIDLKSKDIHIFNFSNKSVSLRNTHGVCELFNKDGLICLTQEWFPYGSDYINKTYSFVQEADTMNIHVNFGQEAYFFYLYNIEFKKGDYELTMHDWSKEDLIRGKDICTNHYCVNILFERVYGQIQTNSESKFNDIYFNDINFYGIDVLDEEKVT